MQFSGRCDMSVKKAQDAGEVRIEAWVRGDLTPCPQIVSLITPKRMAMAMYGQDVRPAVLIVRAEGEETRCPVNHTRRR